MQKHKELREKFGNVLPTDDAVEVLEAIEQWLIERENQVLHTPDVVGRSEQFGDVSENEDPPNNDKPDWNGNCWNQI